MSVVELGRQNIARTVGLERRLEGDFPFLSFEQWRQGPGAGIRLTADSPYDLHKLHRKLFKTHELEFRRTDQGEHYVYSEGVTVDAFFRDGDKTYRLEEDRAHLLPHSTIYRALLGDSDAIVVLPPRPNLGSVTETIMLNHENPRAAAVRAFHEELFASLNAEKLSHYPDLSRTLSTNLHLNGTPEDNWYGPYQEGNNLQGLLVLTRLYRGSITFTPDMNVPITQDASGKPHMFHEYDPHQRYLNCFEWRPFP